MMKGLGYSLSNVGLKEFHLFTLSKRKLMGAFYIPFYVLNIHFKTRGLPLADKDPRHAILICSFPEVTIERVTKNYGNFADDIYIMM